LPFKFNLQRYSTVALLRRVDTAEYDSDGYEEETSIHLDVSRAQTSTNPPPPTDETPPSAVDAKAAGGRGLSFSVGLCTLNQVDT
jgi:hypothetical protein